MRTISSKGAAKRWAVRLTLAAVLVASFISLTSTLDAQTRPKVPHSFWGRDATQYADAQITAFNQDDVQVTGVIEGGGVVGADGTWFIAISPEDARTVKLRLTSGDVMRETDPLDVIEGGFDIDGLSITEFKNTVSAELEGSGDTISVRIIARRATDGRIEFGMRGPDGEDILPPARFFPADGPGHSRWLRSTEIDFGNGFVGRIIARHVEADGRTEFGFRVEGYDDIFPRARFFPAEGPDHTRFLRSSEIEIGTPR